MAPVERSGYTPSSVSPVIAQAHPKLLKMMEHSNAQKQAKPAPAQSAFDYDTFGGGCDNFA